MIDVKKVEKMLKPILDISDATIIIWHDKKEMSTQQVLLGHPAQMAYLIAVSLSRIEETCGADTDAMIDAIRSMCKDLKEHKKDHPVEVLKKGVVGPAENKDIIS